MTPHATFTHKTFSLCILLSFAWQLLGLPSLRNKKVTGFLVLYRMGSRQRSSLIFHPITLVCTPLNSTKTLFSYNMHHNGLHDRTVLACTVYTGLPDHKCLALLITPLMTYLAHLAKKLQRRSKWNINASGYYVT